MSRSFNEVAALAIRAARGAGYPWGLAEEAGYAVRWLHANNIDGCLTLSELLTEIDGQPLTDWTPRINRTTWQTQSVEGRLCPIIAGAALCDRTSMLEAMEFRLSSVAVPPLLLPFAGRVSKRLGRSVSVKVGSITAFVENVALKKSAPLSSDTKPVTVALAGVTCIQNTPPPQTRAIPDEKGYAVLQTFAHRTYAPSTPESRLQGAGAGLSDND